MKSDSYKPLSEEDILQKLAFEGSQVKDFWAIVKELEEAGAIICTRFNTYGLPGKMNLITGTVSMTGKGFGFLVPENKSGEDIFIPPDSLLGAMNGDRAIARINSRPEGKQPEGAIVRILKRANPTVVGNFNRRGDYGFVTPDDKKLQQDIFIAKKNFNGARDGQKVVAAVTSWPERNKNAEGRITEILGFAGDSGLEVLSIIKQHGLATEFSPKVLAAAKKINKTVTADELSGRRDLRERFIVTIDSDDAKDLDDAVYAEHLSGGDWLLGVYIADVSHYVVENSALDEEAKERGTSVYLVDRVLPMLPERLSNGICSLNAGEDRLVMACEMQINPAGKVVKHEIFPAVINVGLRLSYARVKSLLEDDVLPADTSIQLVSLLKTMVGLRGALRNKRLARGAIDFDFPEQKAILDAKGKPLEIIQKRRSVAESIIEEFMLAANETVAEELSRRGMPAIFRVHEPPADDKITALTGLLNTFNLKLPPAKNITPGALQELLAKIVGQPEEKLISKVVLRSLKQAEYKAENLGHFGLAAEYYTHFTSPIRRYPDLVVHRRLKAGGKTSKSNQEALKTYLAATAEHSSRQERAAEQAERDTLDLKKAEYMLGFVGEQFDGVISSVTAFGLFVELANGVEGLLHMSALADDYYVYVEEKYCLIGEMTKKVYRIGDTVTIEVLSANITNRTVDFILPGQTVGVKKTLTKKSPEHSQTRGPKSRKPAKSIVNKKNKNLAKNKKSR